MRTSQNPCLAFLLISSIYALNVAVASSMDSDENNLTTFLPTKSECRGTIAECSLHIIEDDDGQLLYEDSEFQMDTESNRRLYAARRYISYEALRRNSVPCSRRGASYYNCRRGAYANPYTRGCSAITRCRS